MKMNQKVRYAVGCLFELSKSPFEFLDTEFIASRQNIPTAYAHKVLQAMAHAGFVYSQKGLGYKLAKPLSDITALEVIETMTVDADMTATNPDMGILFEQRINKILSEVTLSQLSNVA